MRSRYVSLFRAFSINILIGLLLVSTTGCPARTAQIVATRTVVSFGSVVAQLAERNDATYTTATDAVRARLVQSRGTIEEYVLQVRALDSEHTRRAQALGSLSDTLYDAARIIDQSREGGGATTYIAPALAILAKLDEVASLLEGHELPAIPLPTVMQDLRRQLRALAGVTTP